MGRESLTRPAVTDRINFRHYVEKLRVESCVIVLKQEKELSGLGVDF